MTPCCRVQRWGTAEQPAGPVCGSSAALSSGLVEWEVQSSWTGCGVTAAVYSPPPRTDTELARGCMSPHLEKTGSSFWHLDNSLSPSLSLSRFRSATRSNPGKSAGASLLLFYSAWVAHHYISKSHGFLCISCRKSFLKKLLFIDSFCETSADFILNMWLNCSCCKSLLFCADSAEV